MSDLCAIVLAAGEGTRLRPLTRIRPKALCPVANVPLLDLALTRLETFGLRGPRDVAVNAWYLADQVEAHLGGRVHVSVEDTPAPLGTSGGVAHLRGWIDGRPVLVGNTDAYLIGGQIDVLLRDWDGETVRMLGVPAPAGQAPEFGRHLFAGYSLLPWWAVADLRDEPANLVRTVWRPAEAAGRLEIVEYAGEYLDTGTPQRYLAANMRALTGAAQPADGTGSSVVGAAAQVTGTVSRSVVGAGAVVLGNLTRSVVWPGGYVGPDEDLVDAVRAGRHTTVSGAPRPVA